MQKKSHIILGILLAIIFILFLGWLKLDMIEFSLGSAGIILGITIFYSLLPDIDHKNSTITWWFFGIGIIGLIFGILNMKLGLVDFSSLLIIIFSTFLLAFTFLAVQFFEHRGFTHSIPAGIIASGLLFFLFHNIFYCVMAYVAWHSHLLGDGYIFKLK